MTKKCYILDKLYLLNIVKGVKMRDYKNFLKEVRKFLKNRVFTKFILRYAYGLDASCYTYIPKAVLKALNEDEIIKITKLANKYNIPITYRAAGTSLSGQGVSDSVLVVAKEGFENYKISQNGEIIELEPGIIGARANDYLAKFKRQIGPDPATIATAMIGGIAANNSSGMCCGVKNNSYHTIKDIRVILSDGEIFDTSDEESIERFKITHSEIVEKIKELKKFIEDDKELYDLIKSKFKIKNTTGYAINSFIDFDNFKEIIKHLFIGSEGTLGFISKVTYNCIEVKEYSISGFIFFDDLLDASEVVIALANLGSEIVNSAEMMDDFCLRSVNGVSWEPEILKNLKENSCAILIKSESDTKNGLENNLKIIKKMLENFKDKISKVEFSSDKDIANSWWKVRKGIYPIAAGARSKSASVIIEDICFKLEDFCEGAKKLRELFKKYNFNDNSIIFGHALAGNLHFVVTPDFNEKSQYDNFASLLEEMNKFVANKKGSLKAEHGTGRMVAPFVELEWGTKAYKINKEIKKIFDPKGILNPDVIITEDKDIYKKNLKAMSEIDDLFNRCIECGMCEKNCPSKNLTLTPRQRISLLREMERLKKIKDFKTLERLEEEYDYYGQETCAACSMCSFLCPLEINTANIALSLRKKASFKTKKIANKIYNNLEKTIKIAKFSLGTYRFISKIFTPATISNITNSLHRAFHFLPYAPSSMPSANRYELKNRLNFGDKQIVYFSACMNRAFKPNDNFKDKRSLQEVFESICKKGKIDIIYPKDLNSSCCGLSFENYENIQKENEPKFTKMLLEASNNGEFDIVIDHSACFAHTLLHIASRNKNLRVFDMAEFLYLNKDRFDIKPLQKNVIVHQQCEIKKVKKENFIFDLAKLCAKEAFLIDSFCCCGFAGNKGFFTPELNKSATKYLSKELDKKMIDLGVSTSSTCEIGLNSYGGGIPFINICYLFDWCV